jgi:Concanavalin A-like lectin/glucanases superfamily
MKDILKQSLSALLVLLIAGGCNKSEQPALGDYPLDANPPGGPLKFYAAYNGTTSNPLMNAVDSLRANFPSTNPLTTIDGINGKAVQGASGLAINYPSANDFKAATSFTVAFWIKRNVNNNTEFFFSLKDDTYDWGHSALFMMVEHGSATEAVVKVGIMDQWMEFNDDHKLQKPLLDGNWHHWAIRYDETTSKMSYYFDGDPVENAWSGATDVKKGGNPRGKLDFSKTTNLVVGGWNKHAGLTGPTDDWVSSFAGAIDQFRMYSTVLSAADIKNLFTNKE